MSTDNGWIKRRLKYGPRGSASYASKPIDNSMTKTYLFPGPVRKHHPTNQFVYKDSIGRCWLGIQCHLLYEGVDRVVITPEFYRSFVTEAHHNAARYAGK